MIAAKRLHKSWNEAEEMVSEMTEYMTSLERSVVALFGVEGLAEMKESLDDWERKVKDHKNHSKMKVPFYMPEEARTSLLYLPEDRSVDAT